MTPNLSICIPLTVSRYSFKFRVWWPEATEGKLSELGERVNDFR